MGAPILCKFRFIVPKWSQGPLRQSPGAHITGTGYLSAPPAVSSGMYHTIPLRTYFPLPLAAIGALLLLMPHVSIAQDPSKTLKFFEDRSTVLLEQFRDVLDKSPKTKNELLGAISDLRAIAESMEAEKNLILNAFPRGVPPKEILVLINLVWELGYQAGTAEMLADEWGRLLASPLMQGAPAGKTDH